MSRQHPFIFSMLASLFIVIVMQGCNSDSGKSDSIGSPLPTTYSSKDPSCPGGEDVVNWNGGFHYNYANGDFTYYKNEPIARFFEASLYRELNCIPINIGSLSYERGTTFSPGLPTNYCNQSALPHCSNSTFGIDTPIRCAWEKRINHLNSVADSVRKIERTTGVFTPVDTCLLQSVQNSTYGVSAGNLTVTQLVDRSCVPDLYFVAVNGTADDLIAISQSDLTDVRDALAAASGGVEFCNQFASYRLGYTGWHYISQSVNQSDTNSYYYEAIHKSTHQVELKWKPSGVNQYSCATLTVSDDDLSIFFPTNGLQYAVIRTSDTLPNANTAEITYTDIPTYNDKEWRFYLDQDTLTHFQGGALLSASQSSAIQSFVEQTLISRVESPSECQ